MSVLCVILIIIGIIVCHLFSHPDLRVGRQYPFATDPTYVRLECHRTPAWCSERTAALPFIWFRDGVNVGRGYRYRDYTQSGTNYSCGVNGIDVRSPSLCKSTPRYNVMVPDVMDLSWYRTMLLCTSNQKGLIACPPVSMLAAFLSVAPLKHYRHRTSLYSQ